MQQKLTNVLKLKRLGMILYYLYLFRRHLPLIHSGLQIPGGWGDTPSPIILPSIPPTMLCYVINFTNNKGHCSSHF